MSRLIFFSVPGSKRLKRKLLTASAKKERVSKCCLDSIPALHAFIHRLFIPLFGFLGVLTDDSLYEFVSFLPADSVRNSMFLLNFHSSILSRNYGISIIGKPMKIPLLFKSIIVASIDGGSLCQIPSTSKPDRCCRKEKRLIFCLSTLISHSGESAVFGEIDLLFFFL